MQLDNIDCTKFARLRTFDGYMIGSVLTKTNENRHDNSCVKYEILVNQFNKQAALEIHYGRVLFYFVHEYFGQKNMLAYVEHAYDVKHGLYDLKTFSKFGVHEWISASSIKKCVGFFKIDNFYFILEKPDEFSKDY
ncbi:transposase domain-containing protein [Gigaspora margarita]|uniref:Transposase domain-containing protein n=1 Tax=Gigaspora margarita TaxID=4874 RepID=A0A8H3XIY1_GIGMA|nr:transposase domain-containing protein [Gigaspora margarita]